ncbi:MAG: hypothetical protein EOO43_12865 [Flavobacterium sp.]|nr:MAG: hypothetical protein EOO43_12865 [Flavobacterium sp.]
MFISKIKDKLIALMLFANKRNVRISNSLSKGAAGATCRILKASDPSSWEFSGFSQNGEDGILDFLTRKILHPNHYFIEIGASNGLENNTSWLAIVRKFSGIMIEGDPELVKLCKEMDFNPGVDCHNLFVTRKNVGALLELALYKDPDVFSIDIDGNDFYLAETIIEGGIRPKIFVVEYNSAFGPDNAITIPYKEDFKLDPSTESSYIYYGVSLQSWMLYFEKLGYKFVTVDTNGINAFFVDPGEFDEKFLASINGLKFQENFYQLKKYREGWEHQFSLIKNRQFFKTN